MGDIPAEWINAGARASAEFWGDPQPDDLDERAAVAVLRAVVPLVREQALTAVREALEEQIHHAEDNDMRDTRFGREPVPVVRADYIRAAIDGAAARIVRGCAR